MLHDHVLNNIMCSGVVLARCGATRHSKSSAIWPLKRLQNVLERQCTGTSMIWYCGFAHATWTLLVLKSTVHVRLRMLHCS